MDRKLAVITSETPTEEHVLTMKELSLSSLLSSITEMDQECKSVVLDLSSAAMVEVTKYLRHHDGTVPIKLPRPLGYKELKYVQGIDQWDVEFIESFSEENIYKLLHVAHYMGIEPLLYLICAQISVFVRQSNFFQSEIYRKEMKESKTRWC